MNTIYKRIGVDEIGRRGVGRAVQPIPTRIGSVDPQIISKTGLIRNCIINHKQTTERIEERLERGREGDNKERSRKYIPTPPINTTASATQTIAP